MKAFEQTPRDWPLRAMAAVATLVALQPGETGLAALAMLAGVACVVARAFSVVRAVAWALACLVLGAAAMESGLSPALVNVAFVVALAATPSASFGQSPWLSPWIGAIALTQVPAVVRTLLIASDAGPGWAGMVVVPCFFLIAGTLGGAIRITWAAVAALSVLVLCYAAYQLEWSPPLQATLAALPPAAALLASKRPSTSRKWPSGALLAVGIGMSLWPLVQATGQPGALKVWIPESKTPMSHYFEQYVAVLQASGFRSVRPVTTAEDARPGDWVLLPSAAHPALREQLKELRGLPHYASLHIVVVGEHTDAEGVAVALGGSGSPVALHLDTTIPPRNANLLGWSSGPGVVPHRALALNRGASIDARAWNTVPLVWVQGGHREADRSSDGRLGDMVMRRGERAGLYGVLAVGRERAGPVWVVLGDSTPALNEFLGANPKAFARILSIATGIPALLGLLAWATLYWAATVISVRRRRSLPLGLALIVLAMAALSGEAIDSRFLDASSSRIDIVDRDPYGDRAVGRAVVALSRAILDADISLEIGRVTPIGSRQDRQDRRVSVGHPGGWAARLECVRAGNVTIEQVQVLDVVTCPEATDGSVLSIGADSLAYRRGGQLVVLDQHFLANVAPAANLDWLKERIAEMKR